MNNGYITHFDRVCIAEEEIRNALGDSEMLNEILEALSTDEEEDLLEFISRMHDIELSVELESESNY